MEKRQDIVLGLLFAGLGIAAAWKATDYNGASGNYPMSLGLILALLGGAVTVKAIRSGRNEARALISAPTQMFIAALVFMILIYLVFSLLLEKPLPREALLSIFAPGA